MTKQSDPSEMDLLQGLYDHWACNKNRTRKDFRLYLGIVRLIKKHGEWEKKMGEWTKTAKDLLDVRLNPNDAFRYIQESERLLFQIRDFREGEK